MGPRVGRLQQLSRCTDRTLKGREPGVLTESLRKMKNRANFFAGSALPCDHPLSKAFSIKAKRSYRFVVEVS
jgi:hypothetical protein